MMVAAGAKPVSEVSAPTPTVVVADPEGFKIGLRQAPAAPRLIHDRNADEQWRRGPLTLPNVPGLPPDIQDIAAIVVKVVDPFAMAAFYADLFGFEVIDGPTAAGATLWLGRTTVLELVAGGRKYAVPSDRDQVPDVWIARIYDYDAFAARLGERQVPVVTQRQITGGKLTYAVDPEGHLFGVQQRTPDLLPAAGKERVEDALARDLWAEGH
jgi:predicted enzyme related to lactoylglutathione lyase